MIGKTYDLDLIAFWFQEQCRYSYSKKGYYTLLTFETNALFGTRSITFA